MYVWLTPFEGSRSLPVPTKMYCFVPPTLTVAIDENSGCCAPASIQLRRRRDIVSVVPAHDEREPPHLAVEIADVDLADEALSPTAPSLPDPSAARF